MLIDAAHAEETRVVVVDGNRIEELDFESQSRKQLRGNIYLAKVTRVEPSLQAAFVEYGGNRHGFLAFNEIHPDYYQIPVADREALMREEEDDDDDAVHLDEDGEDVVSTGSDDDDDDVIEQELERRRRRLMRRYKIQEVIRRRQIMLIQVVKEERGNKGAALTTYLSLAGRYCVLMPNTARGGGISRKITNSADRKRLKSAAQGLELPQGMGLIIRTAGASRTKIEIRRDYEYLMRMWEVIRETTLKSVAPALIYAEEDLVKRAIRDMFDKDIETIQVEGEAGYREARDFMRMIMPSQARKILPYRETTPLFVKYQVEDQLAQIHSPVVQLPSGGYLVINQTEALVAVDVNSGRSTRERNVEATALKTNTEAAEEAARQLRLRDLAGLIVIDFIDMDEGKNNRHVEKVLKDCLSQDRARIQMGKISPFGLMEISRQRRRSGVLEGSTHVCEHCQGTGRVRSVESSALSAIRAIEAEAAKGAGAVTVRLPTAVALYVLNTKRIYLAQLEQMHDVDITIETDGALSHAEIEVERTLSREMVERAPIDFSPLRNVTPELEDDFVYEDEDEEDDDEEDEDEDDVVEAAPRKSEDEGRGRGRGRKRRGRRGEEVVQRVARAEGDDEEDDPEDEDADGVEGDGADLDADGDRPRRRRRRGRRGGRRLREDGRPADVYAWVHAHGGHDTPHPDEDPYAWRDPHAVDAPPEDREIEVRAEKVLREPRRGRGYRNALASPAVEAPVVEAEVEAAAPAENDPYVWMEDGEADAAAPAREGREPREGRKVRDRNRRGRGRRGRGSAEPRTESVEEAPAPRPYISEFDRLDGEPEGPLAGHQPAEPAPEPETWTDVAAPAEPAFEPENDEAKFERPQNAGYAPADPSPVYYGTAAEEVKPQAPQSPQAVEALQADVVERHPEPAVAAEPVELPAPLATPVSPREPDPNEITGPPAAAKRGWWRRGT
jgi:ribonuclease E